VAHPAAAIFVPLIFKSIRILGDVANPRSDTKFPFVILKITDGKPLRITSKFGSIPEMYLTLRAWLAQSNA
jgi:hypothetical protein